MADVFTPDLKRATENATELIHLAYGDGYALAWSNKELTWMVSQLAATIYSGMLTAAATKNAVKKTLGD
jgi:hypothetical protein